MKRQLSVKSHKLKHEHLTYLKALEDRGVNNSMLARWLLAAYPDLGHHHAKLIVAHYHTTKGK